MKYSAKFFLLLFSLLILLTFSLHSLSEATHTHEHSATCTGSKSCKACKNCKYCKHCAKDGGTCSVCK